MIVDSVIQMDPEIIWIACVETWEVNLSGAAICCTLCPAPKIETIYFMSDLNLCFRELRLYVDRVLP
jgi:hypothetical protein